MTDRLERFVNRKIRTAKYVRDSLFFVLSLIVAAIILQWAEPSCDGLGYVGGTVLCFGVFNIQSWAVGWLILSGLRVIFTMRILDGKGFAGLCGLRLAESSTCRKNILGALLYVVIEWLPFHIVVLCFLIAPPTDLSTYDNSLVIAICVQLIWLAPVWFRWNGRNISQALLRNQLAFQPRKYEKITRCFASKGKRILCHIWVGAVFAIYTLCAAIFLFFLVQMMRTPALNPEFEPMLYGDRAPIWDENLYFLLRGLNAPDDIEDFEAYGKYYAYDAFRTSEQFKQRAGISIIYEIPEFPELERYRDIGELPSIDNSNWKNVVCLFDRRAMGGSDCATVRDLQDYIAANHTMWERFQVISQPQFLNYRFRSSTTLGDGGNILHSLIPLATLKAAHIMQLAQHGQEAEAIREWLAYMHFYEAMAEDTGGMIMQSIAAILFSLQFSALESVLFEHPDLAKGYDFGQWLDHVPAGGTPFRISKMLANDFGLYEPIVLGRLGNVNAMRNVAFTCIQAFQRIAEQATYPVDLYDDSQLCSFLDRERTLVDYLLYPLGYSGSYLSNLIYYSGLTSLASGHALIGNLKVVQARFTMMKLGARSLREDVKPADMKAFLASNKALYNPLTQKPFGWDKEERGLFFINPAIEWPEYFHLNVE